MRSFAKKIQSFYSFRLAKNIQMVKDISLGALFEPYSETQGQKVGAKESLNGQKNMARRNVKKVKNYNFVLYFSARLDFPSPQLYTPGSPRMYLNLLQVWIEDMFVKLVACTQIYHARSTDFEKKIEGLWTGY